MPDRVWRLRQVDGRGWLRELDPSSGGPYVTGDVREAQQFPSRSAALRALAAVEALPDRVAMEPLEGPPTSRYRRGE